MAEHDMETLISNAFDEIAENERKWLAGANDLFERLLKRVKDFEHLESCKPPVSDRSNGPSVAKNRGEFIFNISDGMKVKVEVGAAHYLIWHQNTEDENNVKWHGGREEEDTTRVCEIIAELIAGERWKTSSAEDA